jgi:hypothetical protein
MPANVLHGAAGAVPALPAGAGMARAAALPEACDVSTHVVERGASWRVGS